LENKRKFACEDKQTKVCSMLPQKIVYTFVWKRRSKKKIKGGDIKLEIQHLFLSDLLTHIVNILI
jgi:hypothetical protein